MRPFNSSLVAAVFLAAGALSLHAQQHSSTHPATLGLEYSYIHTNLVPGCDCFGLQGGGANLSVQLRPHLFAVADFTATHKGNITPDKYQLTQLTYTFGARYRPWIHSRFQPFGEILAGAAHALGSLAPNNTFGEPSNAFALQTGGGTTFRLSSRLQITPARIDYLFTDFENNATNRQNDLRLAAGISITLGGRAERAQNDQSRR